MVVHGRYVWRDQEIEVGSNFVDGVPGLPVLVYVRNQPQEDLQPFQRVAEVHKEVGVSWMLFVAMVPEYMVD